MNNKKSWTKSSPGNNHLINILGSIDNKIENNNMIIDVCENYLSLYYQQILNNSRMLQSSQIRDIFQVIDNRGKTPPLAENKTDYPIIDIRTLTSNNRNILYENSTKYVDLEVYNSWFRAGHPKKYDILLSTVGTIGSMKLFNKSTGCIAQNVVAFRCKENHPLFYYQQLKNIQKDLIAYDIGSVQPSIKISQIDKHELLIPTQLELDNFENIAKVVTEKIFNLYNINKKLQELKNIYLKKFFG